MRNFVSSGDLPWILVRTEPPEGRLRLHAGKSALRERGSAMVEFALVLPVFLLLVTGIFSFGIALNNYLELTDAVALGAQQLSINRGNTTDPCATTASVIYNAAPYLSSSKIGLTFVLDGATYGPYVGTAATTCPSGSVSQGAAADLVRGQPVEVIANYPCSLSVYGHSFACNLHAQITEIVQ